MDKYVVLGNPIEQSKSPFIHQAFAKQTNQKITYDKRLVPVIGFEETIHQLQNKGYCGANVTVPFKEQAMAISTRLSPRAKMAGAVNTLTFNSDGTIDGDNTDGVGLISDLIQHKVALKKANILIIGAGGAVKGVILPLLFQGPEKITIANRTKSKAESIAQHYPNENIEAISFDEFNHQSFDLIINATTTSLSGSLPAIPSNIIGNHTVCYDMVYVKGDTSFNQWAAQHGAIACYDGLGMLVAQAAESFRIWRDVTPETASVSQQLRQLLA